jgi:prostaglandin-endoperoxide synthase 2
MFDWLTRHFVSAAGSVIDGWAWLSGEASATVINEVVDSTRNRPHPWSTFSDYTSWQSLTDRTYLARHLPPASVPVQPPATEVQKLFERPAGAAPQFSKKSTCLFPAFAQYLTDGFIRTVPTDPRRTTTNHEIDLCPLYGRTPAQTDALRLKDNTQGGRGRLKSQMIGAEEFPPFLYPNGNNTPDPQFAALDAPLLVRPGQPPLPQGQLDSIFAVGGDRVNTTAFSAMTNTLLLREHNRVAHELEIQKPAWDDERVFQTARNIMIPMFIKIVVEQYINHITPLPFSLRVDTSVAQTAKWNRPNWITAEFSLLYRWHSLMPDTINWPGGQIPIAAFQVDNRPLLNVGLDAAFSAAARQPAGELGAFNTTAALLDIEIRAVMQARLNRLDTYYRYRQHSAWRRRTHLLRSAAIPMSSRC